MTEPIQPVSLAGDLPTANTVGRSTSRIKGLDGLRGLAAFGVLIYHYTSNYQRVFGHHGKPLFWFPYGALGVQLFFLISGYVIFMTLARTRRPLDFIRSRFSRLFPSYWAAILVTSCILFFLPLPGRRVSLARAAANLTMVHGFFGVGSVDTVYWTLQIELFFYGIMFLLFCCGQLKRAEYFLLALVLLGALQQKLLPASSPLRHHHHWLELLVQRGRTLLDLDYLYAFLIGILIFKLAGGPKAAALVMLAVCLAYAYRVGPHIDFYATVAFGMLIYLSTQRLMPILENRILLFLGSISYSLYLTHQHIGYTLIRHAESHRLNTNLAILGATIVAILLATGLTWLVERPALRLLRRPEIPRSLYPTLVRSASEEER